MSVTEVGQKAQIFDIALKGHNNLISLLNLCYFKGNMALSLQNYIFFSMRSLMQ